MTTRMLPSTMVVVHKNPKPKTWKKPNEPINLPLDCTDQCSMQNYEDND